MNIFCKSLVLAASLLSLPVLADYMVVLQGGMNSMGGIIRINRSNGNVSFCNAMAQLDVANDKITPQGVCKTIGNVGTSAAGYIVTENAFIKNNSSNRLFQCVAHYELLEKKSYGACKFLGLGSDY